MAITSNSSKILVTTASSLLIAITACAEINQLNIIGKPTTSDSVAKTSTEETTSANQTENNSPIDRDEQTEAKTNSPPPQLSKNIDPAAPEDSKLQPSKKLAPLPEPKTPVVAVNLYKEPNQSNPKDSLKAIPLAGEVTENFLDLRGVGDAAMALTHRQPLKLSQTVQGVPANFGQRLDAFDPTGKSYQGDLSFINWESTVGTRCNQFWAAQGPRAFAFMSHPGNMLELYKRGFNLIGLANNHTRDCPNAEEGVKGDFASSRHMEKITASEGFNWLWDGVGETKTATVRMLELKGRPVTVAFASLYIAEGDCTYVTCLKDKMTVLRSLRDADADIRILAMHSWTNPTQRELVNIGVDFIRHYDGDVVFGHGPHIWRPVRVVESARGGKRGVIFESLGNFIHPSLIASSQHLIGRALFDLDTLKLRQVQIIPISVNRTHVRFRGTPNPTSLPANLNWRYVKNTNWQAGISSAARAAYSNILQ